MKQDNCKNIFYVNTVVPVSMEYLKPKFIKLVYSAQFSSFEYICPSIDDNKWGYRKEKKKKKIPIIINQPSGIQIVIS